MKYLNGYLLAFCLIVLLLNDYKISSKGGRGGGGRAGGGVRFGGSRTGGGSSISRASVGNGANNAFRSGNSLGGGAGGGIYRSGNTYGGGGGMYRSGGIRWASFGAGMLAYSAMSRLASGGHYHGTGGYYRYSGSDTRYGTGETCINNEDFNGTKFGSFKCPLPEFDVNAKYCCGSVEEEAQYCCTYFDDGDRKTGVIIGVIVVISVSVCIFYLICKFMKSRRNYNKYNRNRPPSPILMPSMAPMMRPVNRNITSANNNNIRPPSFSTSGANYPRSDPVHMPLMQQAASGGIGSTVSSPPTYTLLTTNAAAADAGANQNNPNCPYPTTQPIGMPQPTLMTNNTNSSIDGSSPPSYSEVLKNKQQQQQQDPNV